MFEITASGLSRARRLELQALVERLRGAYSGALVVGRTAAVVVEGEVDWSAPKLAAAAANSIPVVSMDWVLDSSVNGFLLNPAPYTLQARAERRSSAASTSALRCATDPAPSAPASVSAATTATPEKAALAPIQSTHNADALLPVSLEKLREQQSWVPPDRALAAMFLEPAEEVSPQQPQERPPGLELGFTPEHAGELPSPLPLDDAQDGSGGPVPLACSPISLPDGSGRPDNQQAARSGKENEGQRKRTALTKRIDEAGQGCSATPSHVTVTADSDSDGKVASFLSLMPQVTLRRGGRMQRAQQQATCHIFRDASPGNAGLGLLGSLQGVGSAERPGSSGSGAYSCMKTSRHALPEESPGGQDGAGAGAGSTPEPSHTPEGPKDTTTPQQETGGHCSLPATTLIRLGPRLERPLPKAFLDQIAERHSLPGLEAGNIPEALSFHRSALAMVQDGPQLEFVAGDTQRGAFMLYDVLEGGRRVVHALALVQAIYRLESEVWMMHRYLFTEEDMRERPQWAAALRGRALGAREVLLSTAPCYHSPMHLVSGEFALAFPGRARRPGGAQAQQREGAAAGDHTYVCRKGFDAASGRLVPLRQALDGLEPLA